MGVPQSVKTSSRRRQTPTAPAPPWPMPIAPARLPVQHATQSLTTPTRTVTLLRYTRAQWKEHIAARSQARLPQKILRERGCALALAPRRRLQLRRIYAWRILDHGRRDSLPCHGLGNLRLVRCPPLPLPRAIAARLPAPAPLARLTGSIRATAPPAPPPPRLLTAGLAAVTRLRTRGAERLLAPFEQTPPLPIVTRCCLRPTRRRPIIRWAHGSRNSLGQVSESSCRSTPRRSYWHITLRSA